jgi:hypothetical protein
LKKGEMAEEIGSGNVARKERILSGQESKFVVVGIFLVFSNSKICGCWYFLGGICGCWYFLIPKFVVVGIFCYNFHS